jgi:hypothetical protein
VLTGSIYTVEPVWLRRNCPICGSAKIPLKPDASAKKPAEKMSWEEAKSYFIGLRNDQVFFSYFRCFECNLLYCPWYFTKEQIALLYSEMPDNTMGEDKSTLSKTQSAYVKWFLQKGVSSQAYLEVGPDIGLVSRKVIELQKPNRVSFIEPNSSVREELISSSIGVESIEVVDFIESLTNDNFTLVVGVHVYDHLLNPVQDLKNLFNKSKINSHISIVVHNEKSLIRNLMKAKWPPFCLQHPQLYNPATLEKLFAASGWQILKIKKSTNWYNLKYFVHMGLSVYGIKDAYSRFIPNFEFPIRLGNMIALAEKREY